MIVTIPSLNARQLYLFYVVANSPSINRAANALFLAQPTITHHLKLLEEYCGVKLFLIEKKKLTLTEAGRNLLPYAEKVYNQLLNTEQYIKSLKTTNSIKIGVSPLFNHLMIPVLSNISNIFPSYDFEITSDITTNLIKELLDYKIDLGIIIKAKHPAENIRVSHVSAKEELILVASPALAITRKDVVQWDDLKDYSFIAGPSGSILQQIVVDKFKMSRIDKHPRFFVESVSLTYAELLARTGNGISMLHYTDVKEHLKEGSLVKLPLDDHIFIAIDAISHSRNAVNRSIIRKIVSLLKKSFVEQQQE